MGSRQRPIAARRWLSALALALFCAGCANSSVSVGGGGPQPTVSARGSSALGAALLVGLMVSSESYNRGVRYRANPFEALSMEPPAPPALDPTRRVLEVDCTKPIEDWSANLKCR
jgi:hypothetical protein